MCVHKFHFFVQFPAVCDYGESMVPGLVPSDSISVTSNDAIKEKLIPGSVPKWTSATDDTQPVITLTLPYASTIVQVSLVGPENVNTYNVEILLDTTTVYTVSIDRQSERVPCSDSLTSSYEFSYQNIVSDWTSMVRLLDRKLNGRLTARINVDMCI